MKSVLKFILVVVVNILLLLLLLKLIDPLFQPEESEFFFFERTLILTEYPALTDYTAIPTEERMSQVDNLEQKEFRLRTDALGLIVGPSDLENDPEEPIEILFFGGSTTECFFVDEEYRFPYLAGRLLSESADRHVVTRNAGLMGKHSMRSNFDLMARGIRIQPEVAVLMHNINDLVQLIYVNGYFDGPLSRALITEQGESANGPGVIYRTAFNIKEWVFPNIYRILVQLVRGEQEEIDEWEGWRGNMVENFDELKLLFGNSLSTFISISRSNGIEPVLMTQFNRMDVEDHFIVQNYYRNIEREIPHELFFDYYHQFNDVIRKTAEKEGVLLIDLAEKVPSSSDYMYDAVHLNTHGSKLVAEIISEALSQKIRTD